jgi:hypothetical protein
MKQGEAGDSGPPQAGKPGAEAAGPLLPGLQGSEAPYLSDPGQADAWPQQGQFAGGALSIPAPAPGSPTQAALGADSGVSAGPTIDGSAALAVALVVPILWLAILFAASRNGWRRFASAFRATVRPSGRRFRTTSARFDSGGAPYVDVVHVTFTADGLYVDPTLPFRVFHQPFLVPWSRVESIKRREHSFRPRYRIEIDDVDAGRLLLRLPGPSPRIW